MVLIKHSNAFFVSNKNQKSPFLTMLIRLTAAVLRGFHFLGSGLHHILPTLLQPFHAVGRFLVYLLVIPFYKIYLTLKKIAVRFYAPQLVRHRILHPLSRRYLIHAVIIILSFVTITSNLNANEVREQDYGRASIISALISDEDLGALVEEGPITGARRVTRYLGQTGVETITQVGGSGTDTIDPTTAGAGSALVKPIISPVEEQLRERNEVIQYVVEQGDTLSQVAAKFGVSTNTILWENDLNSYSVIRPGDVLTILPESGIRHTVKSGDTLTSIASQYSANEDQIAEGNRLASADDLRIGEQLFIPGGTKPAPRPSSTATARVNFYQPIAPAPPAPTSPTVNLNPGPIESTGEMVWPSSCHRITQYYGWRHTGVDIACGFNNEIYAADSGKVSTAQGGWNGGYGNYIIIDHGGGQQTLYGHLTRIDVSVGDTVSKGQVIGLEGSTGRSTGAHLHFEVRVGGTRKNPFSYVQ